MPQPHPSHAPSNPPIQHNVNVIRHDATNGPSTIEYINSVYRTLSYEPTTSTTARPAIDRHRLNLRHTDAVTRYRDMVMSRGIIAALAPSSSNVPRHVFGDSRTNTFHGDVWDDAYIPSVAHVAPEPAATDIIDDAIVTVDSPPSRTNPYSAPAATFSRMGARYGIGTAVVTPPVVGTRSNYMGRELENLWYTGRDDESLTHTTPPSSSSSSSSLPDLVTMHTIDPGPYPVSVPPHILRGMVTYSTYYDNDNLRRELIRSPHYIEEVD